MTLGPGIHLDVPADVYHADPCPFPSLSSSIARLLVQRSPLHAWSAHPRLNSMQERPEPSVAMEEGTLLHSMLLGTPHGFVEVEADDWRTKAAKEAKQAARDAGAIPILSWRMAELERCAAAFREQLADHECAKVFDQGQPEATLVWQEREVWCRSRLDWLRPENRAPLFDIKTTAGSADPETWERRLRDDYALQAAFYMRGARACGLEPPDFVFLVVETAPPHGFCAYSPTPDLLGIAEEQLGDALDLWQACLKANTWPGYPRRICQVEAPVWMLAKQEQRSLMGPQRRAATKPTRAQIDRWNAHLLSTGGH